MKIFTEQQHAPASGRALFIRRLTIGGGTSAISEDIIAKQVAL